MTVRRVELDDLLTPGQIEQLVRGLVEILANRYGSVKIEAKEGNIRFISVTRSEDANELKTNGKEITKQPNEENQ